LGVLAVYLALVTASASGAETALASPSSSSSPRPAARPAGPEAASAAAAEDLSPTSYPTITFDEVPVGTLVTDQYSGDGVVFTSTVQAATDTANPTSPVLSGYPTFGGDIDGYFVNPTTGASEIVSSFTLDVGYIDNPDSVEVDAFDSDGNLVQSAFPNDYGINTLTVTYKGMASFSVHEIADEPAGFAIDNLSIDPVGDPTPVTSMASMGDSYSSGEGLLTGQGVSYDCGTDLGENLYFQNTTLPYPVTLDFPISQAASLWGPSDCDTQTLTNQVPADLSSRPATRYNNTCHRNGRAYPVQIAQMVNATKFIFVACSGATTTNIGELPDSAPQFPDSPLNVAGGNTQVTDVTNFSNDDLAGQDPDLITIGVGGNDAGFRSIIEHCIATYELADETPCSSDQDFVSTVLNKINGPVYDNLNATFEGLRSDFPNSTIVAFGYPSPVSASAPDCAGLPITDQDKTFLGVTVLGALNESIAEAADAAGISYVDIAPATVGHEICTADPWFRGLSYPIVQSFHPTQYAHDAIASYFRDHYTDGDGNVLIHNPAFAGDPITVEPTGVSGSLATLSGGAQEPCGSDCVSPTPCIQGCSVTVQGSGYTPHAQLEAVLHSDSYDLGPVTADDNGDVDVTLQVPPSAAPGEHVITLDGTGPDGTPQYGALGLDIIIPPVTPPPPPTVAPPPPTPSPAPAPPPATPRPVSHAAVKAAPARMAFRWSKRKLIAKATCPASATSGCTVTITLRRTIRKRDHSRLVVVITRSLRLARTTRSVTFASTAVWAARHQLQAEVTTVTRQGRAKQLLRVPAP
jgi:hypothetical protein